MKKLLAVVRGLLPDGGDVHVYVGVLLVSLGVWAWSPPAAIIVAGALLGALGLMLTKPWR